MRAAKLFFFLSMVALVGLSGCSGAKTLMMKPPDIPVRVSSVSFHEANSILEVPKDMKLTFEETLEELLYSKEGFRRGVELKIRYRIIGYEEGSRFSRWLWKGIGNAGEGSVTVEAKFFDATEKELATIQTEGRIETGVLGGSFKKAIQKAAESIADYTFKNFKDGSALAAK